MPEASVFTGLLQGVEASVKAYKNLCKVCRAIGLHRLSVIRCGRAKRRTCTIGTGIGPSGALRTCGRLGKQDGNRQSDLLEVSKTWQLRYG